MDQVQVRVEVTRMGKNSKSKFIQASVMSDFIEGVELEAITSGLVDMIIRILPEKSELEKNYSSSDYSDLGDYTEVG